MGNLSETNKEDIQKYITDFGLGQIKEVFIIEKDSSLEIYNKNLEGFSGVLDFEVLGITEFSERLSLIKSSIFVNKSLGSNDVKIVETFNDGTDVTGLSLNFDNSGANFKVVVTSLGVNLKYELIVRIRIISE